MHKFTKGNYVQFPDNMRGIVDFVDDTYITVCVSVKKNVCGHSLQPMSKCCLLVYPREQEQLVLIRETSTLADIYKPNTD